KALARPSAAAFAVNHVVRREAAAVAALFRAGDALREAQRRALRGEGRDVLRAAIAEEREALAAVRERGAALLAADGGAASDATLERMTTTLHAAAVDLAVREQVQAGRLVEPIETAGFDALAGLDPA